MALPSRFEQHLTEVASVEHDTAGDVGRNRHREKQPFPARAFADDVLQVDDELREIGGRRFDVEEARLDLGEVEDVVDQVQQVGATLRDGVERVPLRRAQRFDRAEGAARSRARR